MSKIKGIFEPFSRYVKEQLNARKEIVSNPTITEEETDEGIVVNKGPSQVFGRYSVDGTPLFHAYTTEKSCFIRMMSGVDLKNRQFIDNALLEDYEEKYLLSPENLAKQYILEGGTQYYNSKSTRSGITTGRIEDDDKFGFVYGDRNIRAHVIDGYGVTPMPGITDADIRTKSDNGSLREAKVNFICFNRKQLEILELLYMRPGYPVCLEWGWNPYISNTLEREENSFTIAKEFLDPMDTIKTKDMNVINELIRTHKEESGGNYDGFIGFIKNFEFKAREDGGFDCTIPIIGGAEVEAIDKFLFYLRSIKHTFANKGDEWWLKTKGTIDETYSSGVEPAFDSETGIINLSNTNGCENPKNGVALINTSVSSHMGRNVTFCQYADSSLNYSLVTQFNYETQQYENIFGDLLTAITGSDGQPLSAKKDPTQKRKNLNLANQHYEVAFGDIINLYKNVNKIKDDDDINFETKLIKEGYQSLLGGTILNQTVKYEEVSADTDGDGNEEIIDSGYRKNIYVRWDLVCQMINHLSTHKEIRRDKIRTPIVELTYMGPNQSTFTERKRDKGKETSFKGVKEYINYDPAFIQQSDPDFIDMSNYIGDNAILGNTLGSSVVQDTDQVNQLRNAYTGPNQKYHGVLGQSYDEQVCLLPHMKIFDSLFEVNTTKDKNTEDNNTTEVEVFQGYKGNTSTVERIKHNFGPLHSFDEEINLKKGAYEGLNSKEQRAQIGYIYFNLRFLLNTYEEMRLIKKPDTRDGASVMRVSLNDKFNFYDYIETIWDKVNDATGNYYNFKITTEHERPHVARIVDLRFSKNSDDNIYTFEPQGLKAITRQFYFDTSISNDMASTISIAAQAPNNMQSLASVSFKAFHKNIVSRFANQADLEAQQYSELTNAKNQLVLDMNEYREITKSLSYYLYRLNQGNFTDVPVGEVVSVINHSEAISMAEEAFDLRNSILLRYPLKDENGQPNDGEEGEDGVKRKIAGFWKENGSLQNSAIIPLRFNIQIDGISGMIPLQVFKVDASRLPLAYQRNDIVFIVDSESHKITPGQDWTTEISGKMALLDLGGRVGIQDDIKVPKIKRPNLSYNENADLPKNVKIAIQYLMNQGGFSLDVSLGIVAGLQGESGWRLDPDAINPSSYAYGIAQWLGSRKTNFASWSGGQIQDNLPATDPNYKKITNPGNQLLKQLEFLLLEFTPSSGYTDTISDDYIQNATTAEEALAAIAVYERWSYPTQLFYDIGNGSYKEPHRVMSEEILNKQSPDSSLQQRIGFLDRLRNEMINAQGAEKTEINTLVNTGDGPVYINPSIYEALRDNTNVNQSEIQIFDPTDNFNFD